MQQAEKLSLEQIRAFLEASEEVNFEGDKREEIYGWIGGILQSHSYGKQNRANRGLLRGYIAKRTGLSRAQVTRLIGRYQKSGEVKERSYNRHRFVARYTRADVELWAAVDEAHDTLSGPATRRILQREYQDYGKPEYVRLAGISSAHLYNRANRAATANADCTTPKHAPRPSLLESGAAPNQTASPDTCVSIRCIKATRTA